MDSRGPYLTQLRGINRYIFDVFQANGNTWDSFASLQHLFIYFYLKTSCMSKMYLGHMPPATSLQLPQPLIIPTSQFHVLSVSYKPLSLISAAHMFMGVKVIHWSTRNLPVSTSYTKKPCGFPFPESDCNSCSARAGLLACSMMAFWLDSSCVGDMQVKTAALSSC